MNTRTIQLDAETTVPVEVASDMLATRAQEILRRHLLKAVKSALEEFVVSGIKSTLSDTAVVVEKKLQKVHGDNS